MTNVRARKHSARRRYNYSCFVHSFLHYFAAHKRGPTLKSGCQSQTLIKNSRFKYTFQVMTPSKRFIKMNLIFQFFQILVNFYELLSFTRVRTVAEFNFF